MTAPPARRQQAARPHSADRAPKSTARGAAADALYAPSPQHGHPAHPQKGQPANGHALNGHPHGHGPLTHDAPSHATSLHEAPKRARRSRRRSPYAAAEQERSVSLPTDREAYGETRRWLLAQHGPVCAYCARKVPEGEITLDHVTPRRGRTAYDRRDNLVLACRRCNGLKADKPILAYLMSHRPRAASLLYYGRHLSPMLVDLARNMADPEDLARVTRLADPDYPYRD
ncbi:MAG TPA: HNH endonuclease signature motif containing protein [Gemmatirosa sp.]